MKMKDVQDRIEAANADLTGSTFDDVKLASARFEDVNLTQATFRDVNLSGVSIEDSCVDGMTIDGVSVLELQRVYRESVR